MTELMNRGVQDILVAVLVGLKGFPEAIESVFPETLVQTCIVHLICYSLSLASWKERNALAATLKRWWRKWEQVIPFFSFDTEIQWIIYTTNAIESLLRIPLKSATRSGSIRTPVPADVGHLEQA